MAHRMRRMRIGLDHQMRMRMRLRLRWDVRGDNPLKELRMMIDWASDRMMVDVISGWIAIESGGKDETRLEFGGKNFP